MGGYVLELCCPWVFLVFQAKALDQGDGVSICFCVCTYGRGAIGWVGWTSESMYYLAFAALLVSFT